MKLAVWMGLGLYSLLSVTDWVMTFALLRLSPEAFEANPFASACLERHGWGGLALYKAGGVLVFVGSVFLISRRRPAVAMGTVTFGCAVLLSVAFYSHQLICQASREAKMLAAMEWGRPKSEGADLHGLEIPRECWFADDDPPAKILAMR